MSCSVKVQPTTGATKNPTSWSSQRTTSRLALESHQESCLSNNTLAPAGINGNVNVSSNKIQPQQQQQSPPPRVPRSGCSASSTSTATSANAAAAARKAEDTLKLLRYIDDNLIGRNGTFLGPFGRRKVVYCDYTATGRSLQFLEDYIIKEVLPYLGDTRASTSICSLQSSLFRHEAREIVRHAVGAGEDDAVLFTGQGSASALRTLLRHLNLRDGPTIVFTGPFEHYANLRPWRDHNVQLVRIDETREGFLDLNDLERKLVTVRTEQPSVKMIGYFSAASCITGVLADDVATTLLLRQHGALSIWDYTSAAPYTRMEMNANVPGVGETKVHKDAIIFAGHKFIGGAQSPGVLVAKRCLLNRSATNPNNSIITNSSSSTSISGLIEEKEENFIMEDMRDSHRHLKDPELRDESGTGGVVEAIRCGLAVQLKENLTHQAIATRQDKISKQVLSHVRTIPELILLGCSSHNVKRLPTFSFMVRHPRGTFLHHNFVCAVLNDVFGVQARGGCACAGRYAHDLMGIDQALAKEYEALLFKGGSDATNTECNAEPLRPGFARLTLPYFMPESEVAFVLEALKMVATEGWKLLPQYVLNPDTGEWRHHTNSVFKERRWLGSIRYTDGRMSATERRVSGPGLFPQSHADCLQTARNIFNRARKMAQRYPMQIDRSVIFDERSEDLRWFMLPHEAQDLLLGHSQNVKHHVPFDPATYKLGLLDSAAVSCNNGNCTTSNSCFGTRRLNSEPCRMGPATPLSPISPRHRSLPALSCPPEQLRRQTAAIASANRAAASAYCSGRRASENEDEAERKQRQVSSGNRSPATCPASPMPSVRFAVGEAVTNSPMLGSNSTNKPTPNCTQESAQDKVSPDASSQVQARARCNSLGSSSSCRVRSGSYGGGTVMANSSASSPVPIPLSPQTLASLGISQSSGQPRHRHCSCSSQTELNGSPLDSAGCSPGRSASSLGHASVTSPGGSCSSSFDSVMNVNRLGRSSPILSMSHSSEDDLRAYLKEVTKELATEIKSEIREVISKVDDALSETSLSSEPGLHHSRSLEKQQNHHDSFSASDIAEYLMEFSKEMASEVKSEIRCMVNSVDGLHRYSPEDKSSPSCGSPSERRRLVPTSQQSTPTSRSPRGTLAHPHHRHNHHHHHQQQQQQQDSKMSSECSSDETVIFVVKSPPSSTAAPPSPATTSSSITSTTTTSKNSDDEDSEGEKSLPKIYSAINSVSSQDSGINLSFHDSDRSLDHQNQQSELARSSSAETATSAVSSMGSGLLGRRRASALALCKQSRADELSEDDESSQSSQQTDVSISSNGPWLCPPKNVWKPSVEALHEFDMVRDGDKVLVCLSKSQIMNSICLMHTMHQYRSYARSKGVDYQLGAAITNPVESDLLNYLDSLGVPHHVVEEVTKQNLLTPPSPNQQTQTDKVDTKMEALYGAAKIHGYGVLALAHNLDDLAEAFLGSLFNEGKLATMRAHCILKEQGLRIIRPFVYVREKAIHHFAEAKKIPTFGQSSAILDEQHEEAQAKNEELLGVREAAYPRMYWSLRSALRPLISAQSLSGETEQQTHNKRQHIRRARTSSFGAMPLGSVSSSSLSSAASAASLKKQLRQNEDSEECSDDETPVL